EAALQRVLGDRAGERIGREGAGAAAEHVAGKLVEHDDKRQRALRRLLPMAQPASRPGLIRGKKGRANDGVECVVLREPLVRSSRLPERNHLLWRAHARGCAYARRRTGARSVGHTRTSPVWIRSYRSLSSRTKDWLAGSLK